jgi:hypothetical protein
LNWRFGAAVPLLPAPATPPSLLLPPEPPNPGVPVVQLLVVNVTVTKDA